jgi:RNA polymerase sigma factor (sigma-70 family)
MEMGSALGGRSRELLSQAILDALVSWPEDQRQVFVRSHYEGQSIEDIAQSLRLSADSVRSILDRCDHELHAAIKTFRD